MEFEFDFPVFMIKSGSLVDAVHRFGKKHARIIRALGDLAVLLSLFGSLLAIAFLVRGSVTVVKGGPAQVSILIPGVKMPGSNFKLPFFEGIVVIFLLALFHEGMHALMASAQGVKPKYFAFLLFAVIPAAGVEIDPDDLEKMKRIERARVFAAGSLGNVILALLCLALSSPVGAVLQHGVTYDGLLVLNVTNPQMHLPVGVVITGVNGTDVRDLKGLWDFLEKAKPGDFVTVNTTNGTFSGRLTEIGGKARIGVYLRPLVHYRAGWAKALGFIARVLLLSFQINLGVALINLLPVKLLDGGYVLEEIAPGATKWFTAPLLALILFNIAGPYLPL